MIGSDLATPAERLLTGVGITIALIFALAVYFRYRKDRVLNQSQRNNLRYNSVVIWLIVLVAVDLFPDVAAETEASHRADELAVFGIGLVAAVWLLTGRNRLSRSLIPLGLMAAGLLVKFIGLVVEFSDPADMQGDLVVFLIGLPLLVLFAFLYKRKEAPFLSKDASSN